MSAPATIPHGTQSGYRYHGCPCTECRAAHAAAARARKARRLAKLATDPGIAHGTRAGYAQGCRCDDCSAARFTKGHGSTSGKCKCDECAAARRAWLEARNTRRKRRREAAQPAPAPAPDECPRLHAGAVLELLEARARALSGPARQRCAGGAEARHRRAEILALIDHLTAGGAR